MGLGSEKRNKKGIFQKFQKLLGVGMSRGRPRKRTLRGLDFFFSVLSVLLVLLVSLFFFFWG